MIESLKLSATRLLATFTVSVAWDLLAFAGIAAIAGGLAWIYPPLWLLWIGGVLLALGLVGAKLWAGKSVDLAD
jgi:hypothetical protein